MNRPPERELEEQLEEARAKEAEALALAQEMQERFLRAENDFTNAVVALDESTRRLRELEHRIRHGGDSDDDVLVVDSLQAMSGTGVARLRGEAGLTQHQLAGRMEDVGHEWKRQTVTEVENGLRRLRLEEALTLAALFGVPAVDVLFPLGTATPLLRNGDDLYLLTAWWLRELMLGGDVTTGSAGPEWWAARAYVDALRGGRPTPEGWRPADDLWSSRQSSALSEE